MVPRPASVRARVGRTYHPLPSDVLQAQHAIDALTGSRAATLSLLDGDWPPGSVVRVQATTLDGPLAGGLPRGGAIPRPGAGAAGAVAGAVAGALDRWQASGDRALVDEALQRFGLSASAPADISAARAYAYMMHNGYQVFWRLPIDAAVVEQVAQAVMRHERERPGTLGAAISGDDELARSLVDSWIDEALGGPAVDDDTILERTSSVAPALSASSARARAITGIQNNQAWRAHHLIPFAEMAALPVSVQQKVVTSGWTMDSAENLIALPANIAAYRLPPNSFKYPMHAGGGHPIYSFNVRMLLQRFATFVARSPQNPAIFSGLIRSALRAIEERMTAYLTEPLPDIHPFLK